jgi:hypothetical protein
MKAKIFTLVILFASLGFIACEGPAGPPGPPGFDGINGADGADGATALSQVLEIEVDFNAANDYAALYEFPNSVEVFEADLVLVYLLWETIDGNDGQPVDVWRLLPQTRILDQGLLQYNYDHTFLDVNLFLEADFDLGTLPDGDTQDQVFRIAIVPGEFAQSGKMDRSNLAEVMKKIGVTEETVTRLR